MSQEETLRLVAAVTDKFSGPIAAMRKSLEGLTSRNVASHKAGRQAALAHEKAFSDLRKSVKETGEHVKGILEPAMVGLGIGAISTGAAIAGVTAAIKGFSDSSRSLEFARKETGLTIQTLREFEALAPTIGSTAEAMDQGFRKLAGNLDQWRHRLGPLREFFSSRFGEGAGYIRRLGEELVHTTDNAKALSKINALAAMMPKESERRSFYEALGLDPNLARLKGRELTDALAGIRSRLKPYGPDDIVKGRATAEAFDRIRESISSLRDTIGADLAPAMTQATDAVRTFIEANGGELRKVFVDVADAIKTAPWKEWGTDIRDAAKYIDSAAQSLGGWKVVMEGLLALKFINFVAPVAALGLAATRTAASLVGMGATLATLTAPAWLLALLAGVSAKALIETFRPQPLNKGEDEFARQKKYGLAPKDEDKGVHAAARSIRKKIEAPGDESTAAARKGSAMPISYGGDTGAASFGKEDAAERAILKGTYEGTRQGVIAAFKEWVESRRQGEGGFINANYQPGASGGMGGGGGAPEGSPGAPETPRAGQGRTPLPNIVQPPAATTPSPQSTAPSATPRVQTPATTTPATPTAPHGTTPQARRSEPSEAAAARAMKDFAAGGNEQAGGNPTLAQIVADARSKAAARGVDPDLATGIILGESGLHKPADRRKNSSNWDVNGPSYGAWQLHTPRGLGSEYLKEHPGSTLDVSAWRSHNTFAIDRIARHGTGDWMSVKDRGGVANITHQGRAWAARYANDVAAASRAVDERKQAAKREAPKSESHPAAKGMNEWIEKQRGAHPDAAYSPQSDRGGLLNVNLMRSAREAELVHAPQKVVGDASLKISMHGFPKGTKTESKINGMFKTLTMYRGLAAPMADQEG